jgi:RNA polymerase primary sigma factor
MIAEALIAKGQKQGFVTHEEITALFPHADEHPEDIDGLYISLIERGVEIVPAALVPVSVKPKPKAESHPVRQPQPAKCPDDFYASYLQEIRQIPLLKPEEEVKLAKRIQRGIRASQRLTKGGLSDRDKARLQAEVREGEQTKRKFVEANLRLVASIAWRYRDRGLPILDLIQEGNIGLFKAVEKFDYRLGYKFSTYASWWIRQSITRAIADQGSIIRLPVHVQETCRKIEQAAEELKRQLGKQPTREQLAKSSGMSQKRLTYLLDGLPKVCSLDSLLCCSDFPLVWNGPGMGFVQQTPCPVRIFADRHRYLASEDDDFELPPCLVERERIDHPRTTNDVDYSLIGLSNNFVSPYSKSLKRSLRKRIDEVLSTLSDRQRTVIELRFGLTDGETRTLEEIAQDFGLTRERIRQIEARALTILKQPNRKRKLMPFWID